jgi:hypothetical protein
MARPPLDAAARLWHSPLQYLWFFRFIGNSIWQYAQLRICAFFRFSAMKKTFLYWQCGQVTRKGDLPL